MKPEGRLVWIDPLLAARLLDIAEGDYPENAVRTARAVLANRDAAPADPAAVAATALEEAAGRATLNARVVSYREAADAVMAALGVSQPSGTPNPTKQD